jgi:hypothetical protein
MIDWSNLGTIDWSENQSTSDWVKALNELLELAKSADTAPKRSALADALDAFADYSNSDDLSTITKLDASARKAAFGLRNSNIAQSIEELKAASADYRAAVKDLDAATASLKKEATLLRAERITTAVSSLTDTILALKNLSQSVKAQDDAKLVDAINQAVTSAQKLRGILEAPA